MLTSDRVSLDQQFPALVLAAGRASRMGRAKQLLVMPGRGTLLDNAIAQAGLLSGQVRVVVGSGYPLVRYRCRRQPAGWIYHPGWSQGLSQSLIAGIRALGPRALGVFVLLGDQPLLDPRGLAELARCARAQPGVAWAANYGARVGVPAWVPRALWGEVAALTGDAGAGVVLNRAGARPIDLQGVQQDVDTPQDWLSVKQRLAEQS
nr:nucleotidyltransferase family protein [Marinobacter sp.]